jgi:hypothetical protein
MLISDDKYVYPNQKLKCEAKINILFLREKKVEYIVSAWNWFLKILIVLN